MRNLMLPTICGKITLKRITEGPQAGEFCLKVWRRNLPSYIMYQIGEQKTFTDHAEARKDAYTEYGTLLEETKAHAKGQTC